MAVVLNLEPQKPRQSSSPFRNFDSSGSTCKRAIDNLSRRDRDPNSTPRGCPHAFLEFLGAPEALWTMGRWGKGTHRREPPGNSWRMNLQEQNRKWDLRGNLQKPDEGSQSLTSPIMTAQVAKFRCPGCETFVFGSHFLSYQGNLQSDSVMK